MLNLANHPSTMLILCHKKKLYAGLCSRRIARSNSSTAMQDDQVSTSPHRISAACPNSHEITSTPTILAAVPLIQLSSAALTKGSHRSIANSATCTRGIEHKTQKKTPGCFSNTVKDQRSRITAQQVARLKLAWPATFLPYRRKRRAVDCMFCRNIGIIQRSLALEI